jgi:hypothetical protein
MSRLKYLKYTIEGRESLKVRSSWWPCNQKGFIQSSMTVSLDSININRLEVILHVRQME